MLDPSDRVMLLILVHVDPSMPWYDVMVSPVRTRRTQRGPAPDTNPSLTEYCPAAGRCSNKTPGFAVIVVNASAALADRDDRSMTPAFAQEFVGPSESTRAITSTSPDIC